MNAETSYLLTLINNNSNLSIIFDEIKKAIKNGKYMIEVYIYNILYGELIEIVNILEKLKYKVSYDYIQFDTSTISINWNICD